MIVTGAVSTPLDWERHDRQWYAMLKKHHLTYMNFDDLCNRRDEFKGRSEAELQQIFQDFGQSAHVNTWFGLNTILLDEDFRQFKGPTKGIGSELSHLLDSDYGVSIRVIYAFLHTWIPKVPGVNDPQIYVVAERGHPNQGAVETLFAEYRKSFPPEEQVIRDVRLADKKTVYGVQCADLHGGCVQMVESGKKSTLAPQKIELAVKEIPDADHMSDCLIHTPTRVRWFRLPIDQEVLTHLRNSVILSKPRFTALYGEQLIPPLSQFSGQPA